jgi:DNA repair protein RecN (Recombination protein N)
MEEDIAALTVAIEQNNELDAFSNTIMLIDWFCTCFIATAYHDFRNTGMPNVRFNIDINATETYFQNGKDSLQFLFSANKELILDY